MPAKRPPAKTAARPPNRLTPIKETMEGIKGYPSKLIIYKSNASRFYWARLYFNGKYHIKSTKTESAKEAKQFAVNFYEKILLSNSGINTRSDSKSFAIVGNAFLKSVEKNTNHTVHRNDCARFKSDLLPVFAEQEIDTITNAQISALVERLHARNLSVATIKHFIVVLRKIMKFAIANNLMRSMPLFPKITGKLKTAQKRDYLTQDEYQRLVKSSEFLAGKNTVVRGVPITLELKYLIQFMVNSFIRPSDLRVLKHKHVKIMEEDGEKWLALSHPATKTTATEVQAMPTAVFVYQRLIEERKATGTKATPNDYVFFPDYENRNTAMEVIARLFRKVVEHSLLKVKTDKNITLYSLRHTSIMLRLINGNVNTLALARNARTSQMMIDKFYAAHLTSNMVRKQLHSFTKKDNPRAQE